MTLLDSKNTSVELMGKELREKQIDVILQNSISNAEQNFSNIKCIIHINYCNFQCKLEKSV